MKTKTVLDAWNRREQGEPAGRDQNPDDGICFFSSPSRSPAAPVTSASVCAGRHVLLRKVSPSTTGCCFGKESNVGKLRGFLKADIIAMVQQ